MDERMSRRRAYAAVVVGTGGYTCLMFIWFSLPASLSTIIAGSRALWHAGRRRRGCGSVDLHSDRAVDGPGHRSRRTRPKPRGGRPDHGVAQIGRSFAAGFPSLLAATLLIGVGATAITFGLPKLVSVLFPPDETGFPSSIYLVGASTGTAGAFRRRRLT